MTVPGVGLIFLAVQIRQNKIAMDDSNDLSRAAAVDQIFDQFTGWRRLIASDPEVARVWMCGRQGDALDAVEDLRFEELAIDYILVHSNWANRGMAIGSRDMESSAATMLAETISEYPGVSRVWRRGVGMPTPFKAAVDDALAQMDLSGA